MERKRVGGRFVREQAGEAKPRRTALVRAPRPAQCRTFVVKRIAEAMPELIATLIRKAKQGSYQHMSILARLAGLHTGEKGTKGKPKRRGSNVALMLLRKLEKASMSETGQLPESEEANDSREAK